MLSESIPHIPGLVLSSNDPGPAIVTVFNVTPRNTASKERYPDTGS